MRFLHWRPEWASDDRFSERRDLVLERANDASLGSCLHGGSQRTRLLVGAVVEERPLAFGVRVTAFGFVQVISLVRLAVKSLMLVLWTLI